MGTGASAGVAAAVAAAKEDELAATLTSIPAAEREKIAKALGASKKDEAALDEALTQMFKIYDLDNSGTVTVDESLAMDREFSKICGASFNEEESRKTFTESDVNKDGKVVLSEFLVYFKKTATGTGLTDDQILGMVQQTNEMLAPEKDKVKITLDDALTGMFQIYDVDKSGFVTIDELLKMDKVFSKQCGAEYNEEETKNTFDSSDENKDGKVSLQEYLKYFKKTMGDAGLSEDDQIGMVKLTNDMLLAA